MVTLCDNSESSSTKHAIRNVLKIGPNWGKWTVFIYFGINLIQFHINTDVRTSFNEDISSFGFIEDYAEAINISKEVCTIVTTKLI